MLSSRKYPSSGISLGGGGGFPKVKRINKMYEDRFGGEFLWKNSFCDRGTIHFDCMYNLWCCSFLFCVEVGISCTKLFLKQLPHFLSGYNWPLVTCHQQASSQCCSAFLGKSSVYSQGVRGDIWWYILIYEPFLKFQSDDNY